jgi:PAS domain S-box-containing protein
LEALEILLIEDDDHHAELVGVALRGDRFNITRLRAGDEALDYLLSGSHLHDVVLLDHRLPMMDGIEILKRVRGTESSHAFIYLTGHASVDIAVEAMKAGALDFMPKSAEAYRELPGMIEKVHSINRMITERKQTEEKLRKSERELKIRERISEIFVACPDMEMYAEVLHVIRDALGSEFGTFGYFEKDGTFVVPAMISEIYWEQCSVPDKDITFQRGSFKGIWERAIEQRRALYANEGPFATPEGHLAIRNSLVSPVYFRDVLVSVIHLANKATDYDERDRELLESIADHIAPVLHARLEREREEEALQQSERQAATALEAARAFTFNYDIGSGKVRWDGAIEEILGDTPEELAQVDISGWAERIHPDDRDEVLSILAEALGQDRATAEYRFRTKSNAYVTLESTSLTERNSHGDAVRLVGILQDITERKQVEEERLLSESRLRALFQLSHMQGASIEEMASFVLEEIVHLTRSELGFFGFMNADESVMDIHAWSKEAMKECSIEGEPLRFPIQDAGLWAEGIRQRKPVIINSYAASRGRKGCPLGHVALERFLAVPIMSNERIVAMAAVGNGRSDYSESDVHQLALLGEEIWRIQDNRRMVEELIRTQRLRASGELSAGVSHNLNNILTGVLVPAQLLKLKTDDPELRQEVDEIITYGQRARDLVHRLHLSVRGLEEDTLAPISVSEVVQEAIQTARPRWKDEPESRGIGIEIAAQCLEIPPIRGTRSGLHDILTNLILNAVEAMPAGGTIHIRAQMLGDRAQLSFSDTGVGMDDATRARVFEPFFTTRTDIGTGLGLSTVHNTVEKWGGEIDVESVPGEGTTFTLRLPVWEEGDVREDGEQEALRVRSGKVLVIDDDAGLCSVLSRLLGESHEVETATDGRKALGDYVPGCFDVVLIDLGMSGMSGDRIAQEIRRRDPLVARVLITGWELSEDDARGEPFDLRIAKPFDDIDHVMSVVAEAIELHEERRGGTAQ